ncbi:MAG: ComEC/Rec2 family competence protein [Alphaproteobacteria bacterium]|nr:ComEC/Rec2 family competence protein [Alphaproteobacteria bacterium]
MQKIQELIVAELTAQKSRAFLWLPVLFSIGIAVYFALEAEPPLWLGASLSLFFIGFGLVLSRHREISIIRKTVFISVAAILICCLGFAAAQIRSHLIYTPMLLKKMSPVGVTGTIESIEPVEKGSRVILGHLDIERLDPEQTPRKIRLSIRKDEALKAGQRIKFLAGLNPASGPVAPAAFDFQRMAYFESIGAVGFAYTQPEILEASPQKFLSLKKLRQKLETKISAKTDDPQQSIIIALMTGQRGAVQDQDWDALRQSGLAHLLAISGLHVGMVAGVIFFFARLLMACSSRLALHCPIKKYAAGFALFGAFLYTMMVGATIPTQRALIMTGLVMVAIMFDRSPFSLRLVAFAALVVLFFSPESLTSVSFQMSFAAVTALICFYEWVRPVWIRLHRKAGVTRRVVLYFAGVSLTTLIAGLATGLFALYHFQNYAVYGLLANMIAVPLMAFIVMPLIVLSYGLMPWGVEGLTLPIIEWAVGWILATAHYVAGLKGSVWLIPSFPHWIFIGMVLCLWTMMVWKGRIKYFLLLLFFILVGLATFYKQPDILVSSKVDLISLRDNQGQLWLSSGRKERYTAENWLRLNGQDSKDKRLWPREGSVADFPLICDPYGCRGQINGQKLAVAFQNKAWQEDCAWADILISQTPVNDKKCAAKTIIDYFDVWRSGAYALWLTPNKIKIQTVEGVRGKRLWTQTSANAKD